MFHLLWILLVLCLCNCKATPLDVFAKSGETVLLPCHTTLPNPVDWKYQPESTAEEVYIYYAGTAGPFVRDPYTSRFAVNVLSLGDYTLTIHNVRVNDSGLYFCVEDIGLGKKHKIQLSVSPSECASNPCQNNGTCSTGQNWYTCSCVAGVTGTDCETDIAECSSNPCQKFGTCTDMINGYKCTCPAGGYSGTHCEILCPRDVKISPWNTAPYVNDSYNCSASSDPSPPNYTWYNSSSVVVSIQQSVTVNTTGEFSLTCVATVEGASCNASKTIAGNVTSIEGSPKTLKIVFPVIGIAVLVVLVVLAVKYRKPIVVYIRQRIREIRKCQRGTEGHDDAGQLLESLANDDTRLRKEARAHMLRKRRDDGKSCDWENPLIQHVLIEKLADTCIEMAHHVVNILQLAVRYLHSLLQKRFAARTDLTYDRNSFSKTDETRIPKESMIDGHQFVCMICENTHGTRLPYDVYAMLLMRSACLLTKRPLRINSRPGEETFTTLASVCCHFYNILTTRKWFAIRFKKVNPSLLGTIDPPVSLQDSEVQGVTTLDNKLYVVYHKTSTINVYADDVWKKQREHTCHRTSTESDTQSSKIVVRNLKLPMDIAACSVNRFLYVVDWRGDSNCWVWKVKPDSNEHNEDPWLKLGVERVQSISVTKNEGHIVMLTRTGQDNVEKVVDKVVIYNIDKSLIESFELSNIANPRSVIKLDIPDQSQTDTPDTRRSSVNKSFIVCYGSDSDSGICKFEVKDGCIVKSDGWSYPSVLGQIGELEYIALDRENGRVFVADITKRQVLLLDKQLNSHRSLLTWTCTCKPWRLCYHTDNTKQVGLLMVGLYSGQIDIFRVGCASSK